MIQFSFPVSGDRVHIRGPESAQIGSELTLQCSSEESNPPSVIKWLVDGVERRGTQEEVGSCILIMSAMSELSQKKHHKNVKLYFEEKSFSCDLILHETMFQNLTDKRKVQYVSKVLLIFEG